MDGVLNGMPDRDPPALEHRARPGMELRTDSGCYRILDIRRNDCLIEMTENAVLRGYADIYEDGEQIARCLIVLTKPEGAYLRCGFKQRTEARSSPAVDFPL
jgi:hypothetical protein